jgi:hypothetical protein
VWGLVIEVPDEFIDRPLVLVLLFQPPIQKGADGEISHDRVEQSLDAVRLPLKLSLDRREVEVLVNLSDDFADVEWNVVQRGYPISRSARGSRVFSARSRLYR